MPPKAVVEIWQIIKPLLVKILDASKGEHTERTLFDAITSGEFQLWLAYSKTRLDGIILSRFVRFPSGLVVLFVQGAAGEGADFHLVSSLETLKSYALKSGVTDVRVEGRKGWVKKFAKFPEWEWTQCTFRVTLDG